MKSVKVSVGTTALIVVAADDKNRLVNLHNAGGGKVYLGGSAVTSDDGFHLNNAETVVIEVPARETLYGVSASGTNDVIVLTPDVD